MDKKKLVVLGSINVDHILNVKEFPNPGETLLGTDYQIAFGGKGANQAVAAGRSGANIDFIAAVGDDEIGPVIKDALKTENIGISAISNIKDEKTGVALIFVNKQGENEIAIYPGANSAVTPNYLTEYQQKVIDADAILLQLETPIDTIEKAVKLAHEHDTQVILNPAPAQFLSEEILKCVNILTPNETEAEYLTGIKISTEQDAHHAATILHSKGISIIIITLGSKGAWVSQAGQGKLIPGFRVKAIDTIGAGDTFSGVLATMLLEGKNLEESVKYANAAAALAVTQRGAQPSIPSRRAIDEFIASSDV